MFCPTNTPNWNTYTQKCAGPCPDTTPAWDQHVCTLCNVAFPDRLTPFWDPHAGRCVTVCPHKQYKKQTSGQQTCQLCEEVNPSTPLWDGYKCKSCADEDPRKPAWDSAAQKCVSCQQKSSSAPYWDGNKCTSACPETHDSDNVCQTCK